MSGNVLSETFDQQGIQQLEQRVAQLEAGALPNADNAFNPAISIILDGRYANFDDNSEGYHLPGFQLGGEAGVGETGFSLGHTEITASSNIDNYFFGKMTLAIAEHEGETEIELEEAFLQTLGLGSGVTLTLGRFFSDFGYLNKQHPHAWDFADAPLVYRAMMGNHLIDDGVQFLYLADSDMFLQFGAEAFRGSRFPAGGEQDNIGAWTAFVEFGDDIDDSNSWQAGISHWRADNIHREGGHGHDHGGGTAETPVFIGESNMSALDLVYKWAPNGNPVNKNFKLQFEYILRDEQGDVELEGSDPLESTSYDGEQTGWYLQGVYQFARQWRTGLRYDALSSDNRASDESVLEAAGLHDEGHDPRRISAMLEWVPTEFSRIRLQFNRDESTLVANNQWFVQYTVSMGSHGAHQF
ncbi:MAG: hypothetical protein OQL06_07855 [Gammaproteobacteria bacterium]|nr:hypothetical protein [Gammaproteobacteria bacterium]